MTDLSELSFHQQAVAWGQAYEVLVKRGVLACLLERHLIARDQPGLEQWQQLRLLDVTRSLTDQLQVLDDAARDVVETQVRHLALTAFGVGYTATREYLDSIVRETRKGIDTLKVRAIWCPVMLPGESSATGEVQAGCRERFAKALGLPGVVDPSWSEKGQPANADFLLWIAAAKDDFLLVQEYSYDMPPDVADYRDQGKHLDELTRHRRIVDSRSVFARVAAEVTGEGFDLSSDLKRYFTALTSENKPLFKLCQAASYAEMTVALLRSRGMLERRCMARALAITPNGLESLVAPFVPDADADARVGLMAQLGSAYRGARKVGDGNEALLAEQAEALFKGMLNKLPKELRDGMKGLRALPEPGEDYTFEFDEELKNFANPTDEFSVEDATARIEETAALTQYFGSSPRAAIGKALLEFAAGAEKLSLRDVHAGAVVAGLECAKPGRLNVLALEGNPGIGKTTALRRYLAKKPEGYLFLYVSPRVVINRDVTEGMGRNRDGSPTGILTVTTNAPLIAAAERWHKQQVELGLDTKRTIDGAVVADGVAELVKPTGSMLVLTPEEEAKIDAEHAASRVRKDTLSEHEDLVKDRRLMGVLKGMASTARELLELNPTVNRTVLTAALQGFRERDNDKTTIDALSSLFQSDVSKTAGIRERQRFAQRMPNIVVMVDELAGDGAGARFVHTIAKWLCDEFIDCFGDDSPFTVTLVVSDASLGNETVLDRYLNAGIRAPDKVLVSKSRGEHPFEVAATRVRIGGGYRDTLHVMTNSFPASALHLHYRVQLSAVQLVESTKLNKLGQMQTPREAIREAADEATLENARQQIAKALKAGARQVIYFAQDKEFLRNLRKALVASPDLKLDWDTVKVLDSSVPGPERKRLVKEEVRDSIRVFLMTSSGARGVSFPLTDWIVASVPRFNIESALMEIAQLVYRGRGMYHDEHGKQVSGDRVPRHLVMLVDDYVVWEDEMDKRQWLRQSLDLMTLLVLLRSTLITRIKGDAGLRQLLAIVPVGAVGSEELISLMSQYVAQFVKEAEIFKVQGEDKELVNLVLRASTHIQEIFSRARLHGVARKGMDGRSIVKPDFTEGLLKLVTDGISPLLLAAPEGTSVPDHMYFSGPVVVETWAGFDKQEVFAFEGHETQVTKASRELIGALYAIDKEPRLASTIRTPAINLLRLLQREEHDAANEFKTLKELKSPNTWVAVPADYYSFLHATTPEEGKLFRLEDPRLWQEALARTLSAGSAVLPPLPRYESFPWAAGVGQVSPLKLDLVFDDRYFMASNELNLLNTLLLANEEGSVG
jgi:hypothetical protein